MRDLRSIIIFATLLVTGVGVAHAQSYTLTLSGPAFVDEGEAFDAAVLFDFDDPVGIAGWSYGVCNDTAFVTLVGASDGATTQTANGGNPPGFSQGTEAPGGFTSAVVIDLLSINSLPPGTGYELSVGHYTAESQSGNTTIDFCATLGVPTVEVIVVTPDGASQLPITNGLALTVEAPPPLDWEFIAPNLVEHALPGGGNTFFVPVIIDQVDNGFPPTVTQGFSMGLAHDPLLATVIEVVPTLGFAPDFFQPGLFSDGWTLGVVYSLLGSVDLVLENETVATATYQTNPGIPDTGALMPLTWSSALGTPPVDNVVVGSGASFNASLVDGSVEFLGGDFFPVYIRGDANDDGRVNVADGVYILNFMFQGGPPIPCDWPGDVNDDGRIDMADAITIFLHQFLGGVPPVAPFPDCGEDPDEGFTDCQDYESC